MENECEWVIGNFSFEVCGKPAYLERATRNLNPVRVCNKHAAAYDDALVKKAKERGKLCMWRVGDTECKEISTTLRPTKPEALGTWTASVRDWSILVCDRHAKEYDKAYTKSRSFVSSTVNEDYYQEEIDYSSLSMEIDYTTVECQTCGGLLLDTAKEKHTAYHNKGNK